MSSFNAYDWSRRLKRGFYLAATCVATLVPLFGSNTAMAGISDLLVVADDQAYQIGIGPKLEVKQLSGEFVAWGNYLVIYSPDTLTFRFGEPITAEQNEWRLLDGTSESANVLASGYVSATPSAQAPAQFQISLKGKIPYQPPSTPKDYYVRVYPQGSDTYVPSSWVTLRYQINDYETDFTTLGLNPDLLDPRRVFINLDRLTIQKADEEDDEEPYLIAVAIYLDGTTIDIFDLQHSTVRVAANAGTHGNLPQYGGDLGSGDTVLIPKSTGYFEARIQAINPELADIQLLELEIDADDIARATNVALFVLALEEDGTSTEAADATRDAFVSGLESRLNSLLQSLTFADLLQIVQSADPQADLLQMIPWTTLAEEIQEEAEAAGKAEELDDFVNWSDFIFGAPGAGLISLLSAADVDDVVGAGFTVVNLYELYYSDRPQKISMDFHLEQSASWPSASAQIVHYTLSGEIGRCATLEPVEESGERCQRYINPEIYLQYLQ